MRVARPLMECYEQDNTGKAGYSKNVPNRLERLGRT